MARTQLSPGLAKTDRPHLPWGSHSLAGKNTQKTITLTYVRNCDWDNAEWATETQWKEGRTSWLNPSSAVHVYVDTGNPAKLDFRALQCSLMELLGDIPKFPSLFWCQPFRSYTHGKYWSQQSSCNSFLKPFIPITSNSVTIWTSEASDFRFIYWAFTRP